MGSEYMCGNCLTKYSFDEYTDLGRVPVDPDNVEMYGYHSVCDECGHEFWADRWMKKETIETEDGEFFVSTVFLHLNHGWGDGPDLWYETLVSGPGGSEWMTRYTTKPEAEATHDRIVEMIEAGDYDLLDDGGRRLDIDPGEVEFESADDEEIDERVDEIEAEVTDDA